MADDAERIEAWLLGDGPQVAAGRHAGAIAGWLNDDGTPAFLYPEITGYFLTWLSFVAAVRPERRREAAERAACAVAWLAHLHENGDPPATRLAGHRDWRSTTVFSFDVAMVLRGLGCALALVGAPAEALLRRLAARFPGWFGGAGVLQAHLALGAGVTLPDRWATRPGIHHVKGACALLLLPPEVLAPATRELAERTVEHWRSAAVDPGAGDPELHPALYCLEGLFLLALTRDDAALARAAARGYAALIQRAQRADGSLPAALDRPAAPARSDVLAQALRLGLLLRARGLLGGPRPAQRLAALSDALRGFVTARGSVLFSPNPPRHHNVWAAMFAHQALTLAEGANASAIKWSHALV
jgi:hypothetical protein